MSYGSPGGAPVPGRGKGDAVRTMLDRVVAWGTAPATVRRA